MSSLEINVYLAPKYLILKIIHIVLVMENLHVLTQDLLHHNTESYLSHVLCCCPKRKSLQHVFDLGSLRFICNCLFIGTFVLTQWCRVC